MSFCHIRCGSHHTPAILRQIANAHLQAPVAQLDRAFDYGSKGCRFESCPGYLAIKFEIAN